MRVQIEHADALKVIETYDTPETFFYLDPPYMAATRKDGGYKHELTDTDHAALVDRLKAVRGKVLLSGYPNALYDGLGWKRTDWQTACYAAGRTRGSGLLGTGSAMAKQPRTECVWANYEIGDDHCLLAAG